MKTPIPDSNPSRPWPSAIIRQACGLLAVPLLAALSMPFASAYTVPQTGNLLFGCNTDDLPASGNTGNWTTGAYPTGGSLTVNGGNPTVETVNGVKWEKNLYSAANGYNFVDPAVPGGSYTAAIPVTGLSMVMAVKPKCTGIGLDWTSCVDIFHGQWVLGFVNADGRVRVHRKGTRYYSAVGAVPYGQNTILSLVIKADGTFKVWANGTQIMNVTDVSAFTALTPGANAHEKYVRLGRGTDGWAVYNGNIGDSYVWKSELATGEVTALETDLMAKFHAGAGYPAPTITASTTGGGGTINPSGAVSVPYEADQTFTITNNYGYNSDVVVDSVSQGAISSYTFTTVTAAHTIAANYTALPTRTISGNVVAAPGGGATVSVKQTGASLPSQQTTTDSSGNYTMTVPEGVYYLCASQTGYVISADSVSNATGNQTINFTLTAGRSIPQMETLLFAADSNSLGAVGTSGNWPLLYSTYPAITQLTAIATPTVTKVRGIKYDYNLRADGDGYRLNTASAPSSIPTSGASVVAVVKPVRNTTSDGWNSVVDIFYSNLILGVKNNTGQILVRRNGADYWSTNDAAGTLADGQLAILSLVVQADGQFKVWSSKWNGTTNQFGAASVILSSTATSAFTAFVPAQAGPDDYRKWINIGRNNPDGWPTFNGYIGDTFVYKTALSDASRAALETDINTKTTAIPAYNITATAGANGTISPPGVTTVGETDSQTYTMTPAWGYDVADVVVDTVSQGAITSYTFNNVTTVHTISVTFVPKPTYAISGTVTKASDSTPIAGAKVYVSTTANASLSPLYTLTTDAGGNYSVNLFNATWYVCASATGYTTAADTTVTVAGAAQAGVNFALAASGRNIPQMDQLLFAMYGTALPGATQPWPLEHPKGLSALVKGTPLVTTVDGVQWEQNRYGTTYDGYRVGYYTSAIPINGLTATAVVQPQGDGVNGGNWASVIDVMYSRFILSVRGTDGMIRVCRNGEWQNGPTIPNGQKTILTAVVQPDGKYVVLANGIQVMDITTTSAMTALDPYWNAGGLGFWSYITVGRNEPDGWTTYQGNIGAAMLWKTALTSGERVAFETELGATFGITLPVYHDITVTAGTGGTITPTGNQSVLNGSNLSFAIAADVGYKIADVTLDGASQGPVTSLALNNITANHTVAATFAVVPQWTVTGKVTNKKTSAAIAGASVYFSLTPNAKTAPVYTATTDGSGHYSQVVYEGTYYVASDMTDYYTSADTTLNVTADTANVDFALSSSVRDIPRTSDLLFSVVTDTLPSSGATGPWATYLPSGGTLAIMASPQAEVIDGVKWEKNVALTSIAPDVWKSDGFRQGTYTDPIPVNGATAVAVVKPLRNGYSTGWTSVVDVFYNRLVVGVNNASGQVVAWRNGTLVNSGGYVIPDGQKTVLAIVAQPTGEFKVYANGVTIINNTTTSDMTTLVPNVPGGYANGINVGRNNPDGWTTFNGNIGDVFLYKVALSVSERKQLEGDVAAKFGITLPVLHTITASAGANGSISPSGAVEVVDGQSKVFTINPASSSYLVQDVLVDNASVGAVTSYTFDPVTADHTIEASFMPASPYDQWLASYPTLTGPSALPAADPDGDGHNNRMEFAFGTNPTVASSAEIAYANGVVTAHGQPTTSIANIPNGVDYRAVFGRRKDYVAAGLTYTVQFSAGLDIWVDSTATPEVVASDATMDAVSVPYPLFITTTRGVEKPTFFRVAVSGN